MRAAGVGFGETEVSYRSAEDSAGIIIGSLVGLLVAVVVGVGACTESCKESQVLDWAEARFDVASPEAVTDSEGRIFILLVNEEGGVDSVHVECDPTCGIVQGYSGAALYQVATDQDNVRAAVRAIAVWAASEVAGSE